MIRTATSKDIDEIVRLGNSVGEFQVSDEAVTFWPKQVLIDCMKNKEAPILVAEENKHIAGFIIANYNPCLKKAIVENIFVKPEYRRKGIGESLLKAVSKNLTRLKCEYICAVVEEDNGAAANLYIKNGFDKGINCVWLDRIIGKSFKTKQKR